MSWKENDNIGDHPSICFKPLTWLGECFFMQRRIVSAANKYELEDGREIVLPCVRHSSPDLQVTLDILEEQGLLTKRHCKPNNQGFIDQYCEWWSRSDAYVIAAAADQINHVRNGSNYELYSEGLY